MKKIALVFAAAFMLCANATMAQKVDLGALSAKIEKCSADSQNAKKSSKAGTWVALGDAYLASVTEPTKSLFIGITQPMMEMSCGKPTTTGTEVINGTEYQTLAYPYCTVYASNGAVNGWVVNEDKIVCEDALTKALAAYDKALELDSKSANKIKSTLDGALNHYKIMGNVAVQLNNMADGYEAFSNAATISEYSVMGGKADPSLLYYAGYMLTIDGAANPASYVEGEKMLNKALENGYLEYEAANAEEGDPNQGNIYYYLYSCAYADRANGDKLQDAKAYLVEGVSKFPANERIFEGLMQLYTNEKGMGDPAELLPAVESTIAKDPQAVNGWFSRGRIYYALKNYDECIASFKKVTEIDPSLYEGQFYLGLFQMLKADSELETINATSYTDQSKYNADLEALNVSYAEAIPYFEAAHELRPDDKGALEYLKQLCFRLRDMPGIMEKYTKYNELLQSL